MSMWLKKFKYDPLMPLLKSSNPAISAFARRDLLEEPVSLEELWRLPEPQRILRKQRTDGSWQYPQAKEHIRSKENYDQLETYRNLGTLVEEYGFNNNNLAIGKAAECLFKFQTQEGDFRGIYGNQYSPNYSAAIAELLIKAGYEQDPRIGKTFGWLLSIRQNDSGWAIPFRTQNRKLDLIASANQPIEPDKTKPFSHMVTGVVLRAFAAHSSYRGSDEARKAGQLVLQNFFKKDNYPDRADPGYWFRFSFPFWFTDLISTLDSISLLGFPKTEKNIDKALNWFIENQQKNGTWQLKILKGKSKDIIQLWLALAVCRIFKRFND